MIRAILANAAGATATSIALAFAARSATLGIGFMPILVVSALSALALNTLLLVQARRERARLRGVAQRAMRTAEEDRRRMARDVSEEAAQTLASALLHLRAVPAGSSPADQESLRGARGAIIATMERLERGTGGFHPDLLDLLGMEAALLSMARTARDRVGLKLHTELRPVGALEEPARLALFRVAQEAIDNVVDHANASALCLTTRPEKGMAMVIVEDNGRGFNVREARRGSGTALGLSSMQEVAAYWGGVVRIESRVGSGTRVEIRFPLESCAR